MALTGNKGEWSEPYALLKLLADGKLYLGKENFEKIQDVFYPVINVIRHEKNRNIEFSYSDSLIVVKSGKKLFKVPIVEFVKNVELCVNSILCSKGAFSIPEVEAFLASFDVTSLKAKSKLKNDITIKVEDPKTYLSPTLGFSIKSQLGRPSTLLNASGATNFVYKLTGGSLSTELVSRVNEEEIFSKKISLINGCGASLEFEKVQNEVFKMNLQTIDFNFEKILSEILLLFYSNTDSSENTIEKFTRKVTENNSIGYELGINPQIYEMIVKKFLTDYALGMRAAEVWKRHYQATGGYLVVREDGELICYHFYFAENFENYLFQNTKLETPSTSKHHFGEIYVEDGVYKIKLNLQIRFIK